MDARTAEFAIAWASCPVCGAPKGEPCRGIDRPHRLRLKHASDMAQAVRRARA